MVPVAAVSSTSDALQSARQVTPEMTWALAPFIAGAPTYRLGRWIGGRFPYPRPQNPPPVTAPAPPPPPAPERPRGLYRVPGSRPQARRPPPPVPPPGRSLRPPGPP